MTSKQLNVRSYSAHEASTSVVVTTHLFRQHQWNYWAFQVRSLEWGYVAGVQHPGASIGNQLISLTEVSCLWHKAHRENQLTDCTAENCCWSECVWVCVHSCVCVWDPKYLSALLQWHELPQVCICFKATSHVQCVLTGLWFGLCFCWCELDLHTHVWLFI